MQKIIYIIGILTLAAIIIGLAWAEQITFSSYYPAPGGVYQEFTTFSDTNLATNSPVTDPLANVGIGTDAPAEKLDVSGNIHATGDICTDQGGGVCLGPPSSSSKWQHSGVQIKFGANTPANWEEINLSPFGVTGRAMVLLKIRSVNDAAALAVRPKGDPDEYTISGLLSGVADVRLTEVNKTATVAVITDASGSIEWKKDITPFWPMPVDIWLLGFIKE